MTNVNLPPPTPPNRQPYSQRVESAPRVVVDPDMEGGGFSYDPTTVSKQAAAAAGALNDGTQEGAREAMRALSVAVVQQPPQQPEQPVPQQPAVAATPQPRPAASLFPPTPPTPQTTQQQVPAANGAADYVPRHRVTLQIENHPIAVEAYFHQVIRNGNVLVLVYDRRAVGYPKHTIKASDASIAIHVHDTPTVCVGVTTGIEFPFLDYDMTVILIKSEHPYPGT